MKKILILLAALLYVFFSEAQTKITQDSIESIQGQKVGRLRPVVSNGFYQQSSEGGNSYNKVLDEETGATKEEVNSKVDTSLIITGQEALDSLSANIARTSYGNPNILVLANELDTPLIATNIYIDFSNATPAALVIDKPKLNTIYVPCNTIAHGVKFYIEVVSSNPVYTGENSLQLYKYDDMTATKVATTANDGTIFDTKTGWIKVPFTSPVSISKGFYGIGVNVSLTSGTAAYLWAAGVKAFDYYGIRYYPNYYFSGTPASTFDLSSPMGNSANTILVQLY